MKEKGGSGEQLTSSLPKDSRSIDGWRRCPRVSRSLDDNAAQGVPGLEVMGRGSASHDRRCWLARASLRIVRVLRASRRRARRTSHQAQKLAQGVRSRANWGTAPKDEQSGAHDEGQDCRSTRAGKRPDSTSVKSLWVPTIEPTTDLLVSTRSRIARLDVGGQTTGREPCRATMDRHQSAGLTPDACPERRLGQVAWRPVRGRGFAGASSWLGGDSVSSSRCTKLATLRLNRSLVGLSRQRTSITTSRRAVTTRTVMTT
jgi:hypothetical protein